MRYGLLLLLTVCTVNVQATETMQLRTTQSPPYQFLVNGELSGVSVDILRCVMGRLDWPYDIHLLPWVRAVEDLRQQASDGIFTATPEPALDRLATMSAPFALEKWHWYHRSEGIFQPQGKTLGVIRSSNAASWLKRQGLNAAVEVNSMQQLIYLLQHGRIDAFLGDELVVQEQLHSMKLPATEFRAEFSHYMPLGIYFSHDFLSRHPHFLAQFNGQLTRCSPKAMQLSRAEQQRIRAQLQTVLQPQLPSSRLLPALQAENKRLGVLTVAAKMALDKQWVGETQLGSGPLLERVEQQPISAWLRELQQQSEGLIREIYITGAQGINLAQSLPTSDIDQSDEEAYQQLVVQQQPLWIGPIEYDESARSFQIKVAWPVPEQGPRQGMVVLGLDAEHALRRSQ
ncbi:transporter substrate-binding domain-containing protein [Oceanospirillaceae bacterium ASx5O]|nr:transporter substrate-binding domain-containing protein [Oceanospirillaceae bacterium ASx5O]